MKLVRKTVCLYAGREIHILTPKITCDKITATDDKCGYYYIFSNGTGYSLLANVFAAAISLENNELIYFPLNFAYRDAYEWDFPELDHHYSGIVLFNYCTAQIDGKDICTTLKCNTARKEPVTRSTNFSLEFPDPWKTRHRLTVKEHGKFLIISGNRHIFTLLAQSCKNLSQYGDNMAYNDWHLHHDWGENTAKSLGITLHYWHHSEGGTTDEQLSACNGNESHQP